MLSQPLGGRGRKSELRRAAGATQYVQAKRLSKRKQTKPEQSRSTSKVCLNRLTFKNGFSLKFKKYTF